jgi:hypothetical protein
MTSLSDSAAAPDFQRLSSSILLHTPLNPAKGQLIILATWMGGAAKHIAKYTTLYKRLAPNAKILLIKGTIENMLYPHSIQRQNFKPAVAPILSLLKECGYTTPNTPPETPPRILLHVFSNGGANSVSQLLYLLQQEIHAPLPLTGLIIDSALAIGGYDHNYHGFLLSLPDNLIFKILGPPALTVFLFVMENSIALGRYPRPEDLYRETMLDEDLLHVAGPREEGFAGKRICYFASTKDVMIPFQDVLSHADEAKRRGWDVEMHMWDDTEHCNHLGQYEAEYTGAVKGMWEKAKL